MLSTPIFRYSSIIFAIGLGFVNFIACDAQMYQISLGGDMDEPVLDNAHTGTGYRRPYWYPYTLENGNQRFPCRINFLILSVLVLSKCKLSESSCRSGSVVGKKIFHLIPQPHEKRGDQFPDFYSSLADGINALYLDNNWVQT